MKARWARGRAEWNAWWHDEAIDSSNMVEISSNRHELIFQVFREQIPLSPDDYYMYSNINFTEMES